jgi:hypothetical protein
MRNFSMLGGCLALLLTPAEIASQAQVQVPTEKFGNWRVMTTPGKPTVLALLQSADKRGFFAIQCFEEEQRWAVQFVVPGARFDKGSRVKLELRKPRGQTYSIAMSGGDYPHQMLDAFFDDDTTGVIEVVRWFAGFEKITATIVRDPPDQSITLNFETHGAAEATGLPLQKCGAAHPGKRRA